VETHKAGDVLINIASTIDPLVPLKMTGSPTVIKNDVNVGDRAKGRGDASSDELGLEVRMKVFKLKVLQERSGSGTVVGGNILVCADRRCLYIYQIVEVDGELSLDKLCTYAMRTAGEKNGISYPDSEVVDFDVVFENFNCPLLIVALKHKLLAFKLDKIAKYRSFTLNDDMCKCCLKFRDKDLSPSMEMKQAVESFGTMTSMICFADPRADSEVVLPTPDDAVGHLSSAEVTICCGFEDGSICVIECEAYLSVLVLERRSHANDIRIMKGHQDAVTCLSHFVYRRATGGNHCMLVSGGVDSTMKVWDISADFRSVATANVVGVEKAVSAMVVQNNKAADHMGIDVSIACANQDGVIYIWAYTDGSNEVVLHRRHLGGHNAHNSVRSMGFSTMYSFDDTNRSYNDDFKRLCAAEEGVHHIRREGMIDRGIFLISCDRDRLNVSAVTALLIVCMCIWTFLTEFSFSVDLGDR
jgi:hypothetical protein